MYGQFLRLGFVLCRYVYDVCVCACQKKKSLARCSTSWIPMMIANLAILHSLTCHPFDLCQQQQCLVQSSLELSNPTTQKHDCGRGNNRRALFVSSTARTTSLRGQWVGLRRSICRRYLLTFVGVLCCQNSKEEHFLQTKNGLLILLITLGMIDCVQFY